MDTNRIFKQLRLLRLLEREHLPFLETLEDFDLVLEIGFHEQSGKPLTIKALNACSIGCAGTVYRRLARLKALGAVRFNTSASDARSKLVRLDPAIHQLYTSWMQVLQALPSDGERPAAIHRLPTPLGRENSTLHGVETIL